MSDTPQNGATRLAAAISEADINVVFALSGNQIMPLFDAFIEHDTRIVHARHEAAVVFMAEAHSRMTDQVSIALVTAGPGFANALGATYSALMSEVPVLLLSGDAPYRLDGKGGFQEMDQTTAAKPFVKASFRLTPKQDPVQIFAQAIEVAISGIPGPVHIALCADALTETAQIGGLDSQNLPAIPSGCIQFPEHFELSGDSPIRQEMAHWIEVLSTAKQPLILAGPHLFRGDRHQLQSQLECKLNTPVIILDSPRGLNDPANGALSELVGESDLLAYLGKPVDFTSGFGETNNESSTLSITHGRPLDCLGALMQWPDTDIDVIDPKARARWRQQVKQGCAHRELASVTPASETNKRLLGQIQQIVEKHPDTIMISDGGEFGQWCQGFIELNTKLTNGPAGAIGAALPYGIGAKIARPDTPVIIFTGDGALGFHIAEFETASREGLNFLVVVGNDSRWNAEHCIQLRDYGADRTIGCELSECIHYERVAEHLGGKGYCIDLDQDSPGHLQQNGSKDSWSRALQAMLESCLYHETASPTESHTQSKAQPSCLNIIIPGAPAPCYQSFLTSVDKGSECGTYLLGHRR